MFCFENQFFIEKEWEKYNVKYFEEKIIYKNIFFILG